MRTLVAVLTASMIFATGVRADDPTPAAQLAAITAKMDATLKEGNAALEKLKADDQLEARRTLQQHCVPFLRRAIELAEKY